MNGAADDEDVKALCGSITKVCELIERRLYEHGQKYLCGSKLTVADYKVFNIFSLSVYNDTMPMAPAHREASKEVIHKFPKSTVYLENTMPTALKDYMSQREGRPF